jgi:Na+-driven multidrug efflux pump
MGIVKRVISLALFAIFGFSQGFQPAGILSISRQGLLLIPAILILPNFIGLEGVILAQPIADGLTILLTGALAWMINREIKGKLRIQNHQQDHNDTRLKTKNSLTQART